MTADQAPPELPPYRALLVVDTEGFGAQPDTGQAVLSAAIPDVLSVAFGRAGLREVWDGALFPHGTGDGFGVGFDPRFLPAVVPRVFDELQAVLAERDTRLRAVGRHVRLRMRAGLNVGPMRAAEPGAGSAVAVGSAVVTTHRLLDSEPVRDALARSDPDQTFLAVALSRRIFEDVLVSGYAALPASRVVPAAAAVKDYRDTVYLYVPSPSGELLDRGLGSGYERELAGERAAVPPAVTGSTTNTIKDMHGGTAIQVGHLYGNVRHHDS